MAEGERPDGSRGRAPGAPPDATSLSEARRRWSRYRAEGWLTLAEVRGQRGRLAVLRRLRAGSLPFRMVTGAAAPLLALRRRWRRGPPPVVGISASGFPFGEEWRGAPRGI